MALVGSHQLLTFTSPVLGALAPNANDVRGNDNVLKRAHNAHDADASIHVQSGTFANRPATSADGSTYYATDTGDTYSMVAGSWVQSGWAHWYGSAYDTTDQPITTINTQQLVTLNTSGVLRGVALVSGSQLRVDYAGDYNIQFSAQVVNAASSEHNVAFWFKKNGTNIADSAGNVTVPKKHGSGDGAILICYNLYETMAANDYIQLYWQGPSTDVSLETLAASGSIPRTPSVIVTINRI
jgi:hypothetical protein